MRWTELPSTLEEGKADLLPAHDWASANCPTESSIMCSGNRDLMKAIQSGTPDTQHICQRLDNRRGYIILTWILSPKGIPRNEATGEIAKAAGTTTDTSQRTILFSTAKAFIRRIITEASLNRP